MEKMLLPQICTSSTIWKRLFPTTDQLLAFGLLALNDLMEYHFTGQCNNKRFVELQNMRKFILTRFRKDMKLANEFQGEFLKFCSPEESTTPDDKDISPSDYPTVYEFSNIAKNVPLKCLVSYKPTPLPSQRTKTLLYWLYFYLFDRVILILTCYLFPSQSKTKCTYPPLLKSNTLFQNSSLPPNPSPLPLFAFLVSYFITSLL